MERCTDALACSPVPCLRSDPDAMKAWYGPNGFTITVIMMNFRVGGPFRFTMHGPDARPSEPHDVSRDRAERTFPA